MSVWPSSAFCLVHAYPVKKTILSQTLAEEAREAAATSQTPAQNFDSGCREAIRNACAKSPCRNDGVCKGMMYGFKCDCVNTSYKGKTCEDGKRSLLLAVFGARCFEVEYFFGLL